MKNPEVKVTYFAPDEKKDGGSYQTIIGNVQKIDIYEKKLVLTDGQRIDIEQIYDLNSNVLEKLEFNF